MGASWDTPVACATGHFAASIRPPSLADTGAVSILVRRESSGQTVPIEFELEAGSRHRFN